MFFPFYLQLQSNKNLIKKMISEEKEKEKEKVPDKTSAPSTPETRALSETEEERKRLANLGKINEALLIKIEALQQQAEWYDYYYYCPSIHLSFYYLSISISI